MQQLRLLACVVGGMVSVREATAQWYTQDKFVLSGYPDPPLSDASYAALADLNMTGVFGDRWGQPPVPCSQPTSSRASFSAPSRPPLLAARPAHAGAAHWIHRIRPSRATVLTPCPVPGAPPITCVSAGSDARLCTANARLQAALCANHLTHHSLSPCFPGWSSSGAVRLGGGAVKGYHLRDEPHAAEFRGLALTIDGIHRS